VPYKHQALKTACYLHVTMLLQYTIHIHSTQLMLGSRSHEENHHKSQCILLIQDMYIQTAFYLFATKFYLEILGGLLRDATTKVQLINLARFIPHWSFVVHDEPTSTRRRRCRTRVSGADCSRRAGSVQRTVSRTRGTACR